MPFLQADGPLLPTGNAGITPRDTDEALSSGEHNARAFEDLRNNRETDRGANRPVSAPAAHPRRRTPRPLSVCGHWHACRSTTTGSSLESTITTSRERRRGHCHASSASANDGPPAIPSTGRSAAVGAGFAVRAAIAIPPRRRPSVAILRRVQSRAGRACESHTRIEVAAPQWRFQNKPPNKIHVLRPPAGTFFQQGREPS